MARFGFVGPSYSSRSLNADAQVCMNWYLEAIESGQGKGPFALYDRPGLKLFCKMGSAGGRQIITAQNRTFAVVGPKLWEILADGSKIDRGDVGSDGQTVSMANGQTQLLLASAGIGYVFDLSTNGALVNLTEKLGAPPVLQVGYSDGFFLALIQGENTNTIQASNAQDALTWDPTSFTGVSVFTDRAKAMFIDHREMWVWGPRATQPYFNAGSVPFPFEAIQGGFIESGIAARFSPAKADNSIFWLESNDRGECTVRRANGYSPVRVSNHALEYALSTYPTITDAVGYSYTEAGHEFYCLSFPSADKMWALDTATGQWAERGFWNEQSATFTRHRAQYHTFNFGKHLVLDPVTGDIYEQSTDYFNDFGNPLRRVRRAPHVSTEQQWIIHTKLQLDVETGLGNFKGIEQPMRIPMVDASGTCHSLMIGTDGILQAPVDISADPDNAQRLFMNDVKRQSSWEIVIDAVGIIQAVPLPKFDAGNPSAIQFVSAYGDENYTLQLVDLGGGNSDFQVNLQGTVTRGQTVTMRYSDDGGHTWSNPQDRDCGAVGEYRKRVIWRNLGRSRDRIYEISTADDAPCRIIDAYLDASGLVPQKRLAQEARERA